MVHKRIWRAALTMVLCAVLASRRRNHTEHRREFGRCRNNHRGCKHRRSRGRPGCPREAQKH